VTIVDFMALFACHCPARKNIVAARNFNWNGNAIRKDVDRAGKAAMNTATTTILVIDDERDSRAQLVQLLQSEGYRTETATNGKKALAAISANPPDLILLDVTMPGMDGFEVASTLKATPDTANIPIIMVTAHVGRGARVVGLDSGAEEYLTKPVDPAELSLRVRNLLRLEANSSTAADATISDPVGGDAGHQAFYDAVTGLPNAAQFREALRKAIAEAESIGATVSVLSIDVDNFTQINGTQGIEFGDQLLRHMGSQLVQQTGSRDSVGRLNEDKFAVVLPAAGDAVSATAAADMIRSLLHTPVAINGKDVCPTASVGIALYPQHGCDVESLIRHADAARRVAKQAGGDATRLHKSS
jgi:diguanylate cyclase (GGDEF)-like protein